MSKLSGVLTRRSASFATFGALALLAATSIPLSQTAYAAPPWQKQSAAELSQVWWQWVFSVPGAINPLRDTTGQYAHNGQPYESQGLMLLAGGGFDASGVQTRAVTVKKGIALFFPLINVEADNVGNRPNLGGRVLAVKNSGVKKLEDLINTYVNMDPSNVSGLFATLTRTDSHFNQLQGEPVIKLDYVRAKSKPFNFWVPAGDNLYKYYNPPITVSGRVAPVVADGWYSSVEPGVLEKGYWKLTFGAATPFAQNITYNITAQ